MKLKYGELWSRWDEADLFLVTTNATVRGARLVMGAGTAEQARSKFGSDLTKAVGETIMANGVRKEYEEETVYNPYYLMISPRWPVAKLGLFQTKDHYKDNSDIFIISSAVNLLAEWIPRGREKLGRDPLVAMPFPGVGYGGLSEGDVIPYLKQLPDNVEIWRREGEEPITLPLDHPLELLIHDYDDMIYLNNLCITLGVKGGRLRELTDEIGVGMGGLDTRGKLQRYFLIKAYMESGDVGGAWHTSRSELRRILDET